MSCAAVAVGVAVCVALCVPIAIAWCTGALDNDDDWQADL